MAPALTTGGGWATNADGHKTAAACGVVVLLMAAVFVGLGAAISDWLGVSRESWTTPYGLTAGGLGAFFLVACAGLVGGLLVGAVQVARALWRCVRRTRPACENRRGSARGWSRQNSASARRTGVAAQTTRHAARQRRYKDAAQHVVDVLIRAPSASHLFVELLGAPLHA